MPSSTSSSELLRPELRESERPGFVRLTAADRPGVAQPVPERDIPLQPWGRIALGAVLLLLVLLAGWESYWRAFGAQPSYRNSDGEWALQRRRIDYGEEINKAACHRDVGDVCRPHLVGTVDLQSTQQIGINLVSCRGF